MIVNRRDFSARLLGASAGAGVGAASLALSRTAAAQGGPVEGAQYSRVEPSVPSAAGAKIEVLEFFSYACPHCSAFEPALDAWAKKLPADVAFRRVPAPFLMNAETYQRTYYTLETLGQVDAMQRKIFSAIHVDRMRLDKPEEIAALMAKNGIDSAKFMNVFNSFSVATSVTRAKKLAADYKLDGVPSLAVQGRYVTSPGQAGSPERALAVVDFLVQKSRKA